MRLGKDLAPISCNLIRRLKNILSGTDVAASIKFGVPLKGRIGLL